MEREPRIRIRRMTEGDLDEVLEIEGRSFASPWSRGLFERELATAFSRIFVAERPPGEQRARAVLGYLCLWFVAGEAHILNLAVHPEERHCGVGGRLLEHALADCRENGIQEMTLEVRRSNSSAISLYRNFQFLPLGIRPRYYRDNGEDAILMGRVVNSSSPPASV